MGRKGTAAAPAFREGARPGSQQAGAPSHPSVPSARLPGRRFCDRGISISVKSRKQCPPVRGDEKSGAGCRGAFKSPRRWDRTDPRGRLRGDEGGEVRAACACFRGDPRPGVQDGLGGSQPRGNRGSSLPAPHPTRTTGPAPRLCPETTALGPAPERASLDRCPQSLEP